MNPTEIAIVVEVVSAISELKLKSVNQSDAHTHNVLNMGHF